MGEQESDECRGEGYSRQRHVSLKLQVMFYKPQGAWYCWSPGAVRFTLKWQELKLDRLAEREKVERFSYLPDKLILQEKLCT